MSNHRKGDVGSREERARNPTKGLRQKLRMFLRYSGVGGKFRTDEMRDGSLVVRGALKNNPDIRGLDATFMERKVRFLDY